MAMHAETQPGRPSPLGSTVAPEGVNFSLFSKGSTQVELLLFERVDRQGAAYQSHLPAMSKVINQTRKAGGGHSSDP